MCLARNSLLLVAAVAGLLLSTAPAIADWDPPGDPNTKWTQLPDLTPNGMDVKVTRPKILADDWQCTDDRPVTDIHIWGSWKNDQEPMIGNPTFILQIWSDQAAGSTPGAFSRPKDLLWEATDFSLTYRQYFEFPAGTPGEYWYDPNTQELLPNNDRIVWQANFDVSKNPFAQTKGEIYWLAVQMYFPNLPADANETAQLGWKTRSLNETHFNDDAVWADLTPTAAPTWHELRYPIGHQYEGQSVDLAFVITVPEPGTLALLGMAALGLLVYAWRRRRS
jgi:hypothetical protein